MGAAIWTEAEARAFAPPEKLTPSEWTEKYRILPPNVAEPGELKWSRTPYMVGIIDCIQEPGVESICFLKSAQIGWSTLTESLVGYWVDNDPGPILFLLDTEDTANDVMDERLTPLVRTTEAVRRHLSPHNNDWTKDHIKFDTCDLFMAWPTPSKLARREVRYFIGDEIDKYRGTGNEGDPISLASERTATFGYRRKELLGSTPTVRSGAIWRAWESSGDKRRYYVPCPFCSHYQTLVFSQIKYPKLAIEDDNLYADTIKSQNLAYYECEECKAPIKNGQKQKMTAKGVWLSETQKIDKNGVVTGQRPRATRVGFWINALYSPFRTFSEIAAKHRKALANPDPGEMKTFKNSWLAEPFEEIVQTASVDDFRKLTEGAPPPLIIPAWADQIIATADVHLTKGLYWVIRAWGANYKSQLITYGIANNFDELYKHTLQTQFILETGSTSLAHALFIDAGFRTDEVYQFAQTDVRIQPVKGDNDSQTMPTKRSDAGKAFGIVLHTLNTQLLKDRLSVFRSDTKGRWLLNSAVDEEYLKQLAAEHKVMIKGVYRWEKKSVGGANHFLDCEVYQIAGADIRRIDMLTDDAPIQNAASQTQPTPVRTEVMKEFGYVRPNEREQNSFLGNTSGWIK
jgi:phage terminase large subunit GpA-like protein